MSISFGCKRREDRVGVLLAQLGTPNAPTTKELRKYLRQFLSDRRVVEVNAFLWWIILRLFILPRRPARSAALYKRIWRQDGSPLLSITRAQSDALAERLNIRGLDVEVRFGMRYGIPSLAQGIDELLASGCSKILLFPMYPQYAAATSASTYDAVFSHVVMRRWVPTLRVAEPYYRHPAYLQALAAGINSALENNPNIERLLLSYHGVPCAYIEKGDPYCCMCTETSAALKPMLSLEASRVLQTYQSRFGKEPWLQPYTDETIRRLAKEGVKHIAVALPGFTADCLETLDEIGNEARHMFMEQGGATFTLVPCLNAQGRWIDALETLVLEELGSWLRSAKSAQPCADVTCPANL